MTVLRLNLFGGVEVKTTSGETIPMASRKAAALLGYLALNARRGIARARLATLLWDGRFEDLARANLRQALTTLRRAVPQFATVIDADRDDIRVCPDAVTTDVGEFESLLLCGEPVGIGRAAAMYQGDLLDGLGATSFAFEAWLTAERQRLNTLALVAMSGMLEMGGRERVDCAILLAQRLLAIDPLQEQVHRALMRCYAQLGRRADALRQYDRCRTALRREIGTAPEGETERLQRDIRRHASHI